MNKYILTTAKGMITGLLLEDEKPVELRVYDEESKLGNIYVGKVSNVVKNINAAFIDIQKGLSCYMPLDDYHQEGTIKAGDEFPVQLSKEAVKTKQPTVTDKLSLTGSYVVLSLYSPIGVSSKIKDADKKNELKAVMTECIGRLLKESHDTISDVRIIKKLDSIGGVIRTRSENADISDICAEITKLYNLLSEILCKSLYAKLYSCMYKPNEAYMADAAFFFNQNDTRLITDIKEAAEYLSLEAGDEAADSLVLHDDKLCSLNALYNVDRVIEKLLSKTVYLNSGAYLIIEPTEAMTVIDVNSGKAIKGGNVEESMHKINLEAAKEIARQLRLRNISGIVMIDFISIKNDSKNKELLKALEAFVEKDNVPANVVDMTGLGLVELTRKKVRKPLIEVMGYR